MASRRTPTLPPELESLAQQLMAVNHTEQRAILDRVQAAKLPPPHRILLFPQEVIAILGLDRLARPDNVLRELVKTKQLRVYKIGSKKCFRREQVELIARSGTERRRGRPPGSKNRPKPPLAASP